MRPDTLHVSFHVVFLAALILLCVPNIFRACRFLTGSRSIGRLRRYVKTLVFYAHHITAHSKRRGEILIYHSAGRIGIMTNFVIAALAAVTLMQPASSVARDQSTDSPEPSPVPLSCTPHTTSHVYGAPIQPAVVGHARTSHHKATPKKRSSKAANRH